MTSADRRRDAVARIIRSRRIGTQEELLAALEEAGFQATQATLSRDLARLGARRVSRSAASSPGSRRTRRWW
jgi:transcriptional regulator of arginine metabolism